MKKGHINRVSQILVVLLMVVSLIAGCAKTPTPTTAPTSVPAVSAEATATTAPTASVPAVSAEATATTAPTAFVPDTSKKVEVIMYLAGDGGTDSPLVQDKLNEMLAKDLNCSVKINNIAWADWGTKYPLILSAGESYDLIYTSDWAGYATQVQKGTYMALDDLLPKYAPTVLSQTDALGWKEVSFEGKIYALPAREKNYVIQVKVIRGDLREKYGLPAVTDFASLEAYMDAVKTNEPDIIPWNGSPNDNPQFAESIAYDEVNYSGLYASPDKPTDVMYLTMVPGYLDYVKMVQRWHDKGYISKSMLSAQVNAMTNFKDGKTAVCSGNTVQCKQVMEAVISTHPEWKPEYIVPKFQVKAVTHPNDWTSNMMAVGKDAANPERAIMVVDKFRSSQDYYDTLFYGIKGKDYDLTSDGLLIYPTGVDGKNTGYTWDNEGQWGFRVFEMIRKSQSEWMDYYNVVNKTLDTFATPNPYGGYLMKTEGFSTESAAVATIITQYQVPLSWGFTTDPEADLKALNDKIQAAGGTKILADVKAQLVDFFATK